MDIKNHVELIKEKRKRLMNKNVIYIFPILFIYLLTMVFR